MAFVYMLMCVDKNFRDDVMSKRKEQMRLRKEMREKAELYVKEEAIKSDK